MSESSRVPLTPEILIPRLGEYLVERGLVTPQQLQQALEQQSRLRNLGETRPLGYILVEMGALSREDLDAATTEQLIQLRSALQEANEHLERRVRERTAELQTALQQLSSINDLKANLVANISHELRTPLTHLKGYLELLLAGEFGPLNTEQLNALGIIQRSAERLGNLIEDLIQFSVTERDQVYLHVTPSNLYDLTSSVYKRSLSKARDHQIALDLKIPTEPYLVDADFEKISWVLMQLVDNAIKFTPPGGKVILQATPEDNFIQFQVIDTGIGVPPDRIDQIFEPFFQLDGSSTRKAGGTGLGLALARRIVEAHGSVIHVYSRPGEGSQFEFALKVHQD
ncbi:signal transduction histidine kinase [Anaerolinea thermolimosa]|nr:HAMP domain-containing sensor histidine kinase [Anaerolinea thermolimosa]GAP05707.1 signal transduction histidine kinase [Anaerolinea thermolimosa]